MVQHIYRNSSTNLFLIFSEDKNHFINVMNKNNGQYLLYLCRQFYGRPNYSNLIAVINYNSSSPFPKLYKQLVVVTHYDTSRKFKFEFNAWAYNCPLYDVQKKKPTNKFKIIPGPQHDSVMIIKKIEHTYFVHEIIKNLHVKFLYYLI